MADKKPRTIRTVSDLTRLPDKQNPRVRTPRNRKVMEHSLRTLGAGRSILADETGQIIAGNGTAEAAAKVGITKVRLVKTDGKELVVVQRSDLTAQQKREMSVADNAAATYSEWSEDLETISEGVDLSPYFTSDELDSIGGESDAASFHEMEISKPAPDVVWILLGINVNDYGAVMEYVAALESSASIIVKTSREKKTS
jgi:hypothetical protein